MLPKRILWISARCYSLLLLAYPIAFRRAYATEMMQVFHDMYRDAFRRQGYGGLLGVWFCVLPDWIKTVCEQRFLTQNAPIKRRRSYPKFSARKRIAWQPAKGIHFFLSLVLLTISLLALGTQYFAR